MIAPLVLAVLFVAAAFGGAFYDAAQRLAGPDTGSDIPVGPREESPSPSPAESAVPGPSATPTAAQLVNEFSMAGYTNAVKTGKVAVLYYYADWCPVCQAEFPVFQEAVRELNESRVVAYRVNYNDSDTDAEEKAAAKTFQVGSQHTLVVVKSGTLAFKGSTAGWAKDDYLARIREFLP